MSLFRKKSEKFSEKWVQDQFSVISKKLFRTSLNYQVSFLYTRSIGCSGQPIEITLKAMLKDELKLGRSRKTSVEDFLSDVITNMRYEGDSGAHPSPDYIKSQDFESDLSPVIYYLQQLANNASCITSICLEFGHPFYPVFWEFAYMLQVGQDTHLLIGSASD